MFEIIWKGNNGSNFYPDRRGQFARAICNHISVGTMGSMYNTFSNPKNVNSSAHFGVGRDGTIHQYVDIKDGAWTQGISQGQIPMSTAPIVKDLGIDPNLYCTSIEHEGYTDQNGEVMGVDGNLTEIQFYASCWLHKWIQKEVEDKWGIHILLGPYNVIGHFQINPRDKPYCPGLNFPWSRLYAELAIAEIMTFEEYSIRVQYKLNANSERQRGAKVVNRIYDLWKKVETPNQYEHNAIEKLLSIEKYMLDNDIMNP